jgi:hypothetical protein
MFRGLLPLHQLLGDDGAERMEGFFIFIEAALSVRQCVFVLLELVVDEQTGAFSLGLELAVLEQGLRYLGGVVPKAALMLGRPLLDLLELSLVDLLVLLAFLLLAGRHPTVLAGNHPAEHFRADRQLFLVEVEFDLCSVGPAAGQVDLRPLGGVVRVVEGVEELLVL